MCNTNKQNAIHDLKIHLNYMAEDVSSALHQAEHIGDKELTEKLTAIKTQTLGVKDYIAKKTDAKTG